MARGAHETLGDRILGGLVITKRGSSEPLPVAGARSGSPMPDEASPRPAKRSLLSSSNPFRRTHRYWCCSPAVRRHWWKPCRRSGAGAVAGAEPQAGLARASIFTAMNAIRKRISLLKGGRLAQLLYPRKVLCLAISDVSGDDPRSIGSGPLVAEPEVEYPPTFRRRTGGVAHRVAADAVLAAPERRLVFEASNFKSSPGLTMPSARPRRQPRNSDIK